MANLIRLKPVIAPTIRSLLSICPRTFTSHAQPSTQLLGTASSCRFARTTALQSKYFSAYQIRSSSSESVASTNAENIRKPDKADIEAIHASITDKIKNFDLAISYFESKCQRADYVLKTDYLKTFDTFTRLVRDIDEHMDKLKPEHLSNLMLFTNILLRCCGRLMLNEDAKHRELLLGSLWMFLKEKSIPMDITHYNSFIRAMNENQSTYDPAILLAEIEKADLKPDRVTYQRMIHQYCLQGNIAGATGLLETMKTLGMELNEQIFASLITGYSKLPEGPSVKEIFTLMRSNGIEPNSSSYCAGFLSLASKLDADPDILAQFDEIFELYSKDEVQFTEAEQMELLLHLSPLISKSSSIPKLLDEVSIKQLHGTMAVRARQLALLVRANCWESASKLFWSQNTSQVNDGRNVVYSWIKILATNTNVPIDFIIKECNAIAENSSKAEVFQRLFFFAANSGRKDLIRETLKILSEDETKIIYYWPLIAQSTSDDEILSILKNDLSPSMPSDDLHQTFQLWIWPKMSGNINKVLERNGELKYDVAMLTSSFISYAITQDKQEDAIKLISGISPDLIQKIEQEDTNQTDSADDDEAPETERVRRSGRRNLTDNLLHQIADETKDPELVKKGFNLCYPAGKQPTNRAISAIVRVHLLSKDYNAAIQEAIRLSKQYSALPCRGDLIRHCLEMKDPENLQKIMSRLTELYGETNALFDLAFNCLITNKLKQAQKIFASPGFRVHPRRIIDGCRALSRSKSVDALENLVQLTRDMSGVDQDQMYKMLIETYENTANARRILDLWNMMQEEEFQPSRKSSYLIADALQRNNMEVPFQLPQKIGNRAIAEGADS